MAQALQQARAFSGRPQAAGRQLKAARPACVRVLASARAQQRQQHAAQAPPALALPRRALLQAGLAAGLLAAAPRPAAAAAPPAGFKLLIDKLDGYSFVYPELWATVTTSGNDVFLRNPFNIEENLFVDISSPSSSRYAGVSDLGSPEDAAKALLDQYLNKEFMSTRIGGRAGCGWVGGGWVGGCWSWSWGVGAGAERWGAVDRLFPAARSPPPAC
jgi:hypothetical protein